MISTPSLSTNQFSSVLESVIYKIENTSFSSYPYPHCFIPHIFPDDFFKKILMNIPMDSCFKSLSETGTVKQGTYKERSSFSLNDIGSIEQLPLVNRIFWHNFVEQFSSTRFLKVILQKLQPFLSLHPIVAELEAQGCSREKMNEKIKFKPHVRLLRDRDHYQIGPHTDSPQRLASLLFYLPQHDGWKNAGTSLYIPKEADFRCAGGPHYPFQHFEKIFTAPYQPNSLLLFMKTDRSFHGVEPIHKPDICRDQVLYFVQIKPTGQVDSPRDDALALSMADL